MMRARSAAVHGDRSVATYAASAPVVLIPAYRPSPVLLKVVNELSRQTSISMILVVDDGSGSEFGHIFRQVERVAGVEVLRHERNQGKGAALKTGLQYAAQHYPSSAGIVTADADGQHTPADIANLVDTFSATPDAVVMGVRTMDASAPLRSRFGNRLTRWMMRLVAGQRLSDTQTGLRAIPMSFVPDLLKLRSTHYDFEMDMLIACRETDRVIQEVPIQTVYIDNNRDSHFRPVRDSMRVYSVFLRFCGVSLVTSALDNLLFMILLQYLPYLGLCQAISRSIAGTFQFFAGKRGVFQSRTPVAPALLKFWMLVATTGVISYLLIRGLLLIPIFTEITAKLTAETLLFFVSFAMQRRFVFNGARATSSALQC